ncbi:hypothetical protein H0H92_010550, partial [Tricholoma furcatifolium]
LTASSLSGVTQTILLSDTTLTNTLDAPVANLINQYNTTLPGAAHLVHIMMLDAQQFFVKEGTFPLTLAALDFPA